MKKLTTLEVNVYEKRKGEPIGDRLAKEDLMTITIRFGSKGKVPVELSTEVIEKSNLPKLIACLESLVILLKEDAKNQTY